MSAQDILFTALMSAIDSLTEAEECIAGAAAHECVTPDVTDLRAERDALAAKVRALEGAGASVVDVDRLADELAAELPVPRCVVASIINTAIPAATVPAGRVLGPTQVAVDLSDVAPTATLRRLDATGHRPCASATELVAGIAARAELARRGDAS